MPVVDGADDIALRIAEENVCTSSVWGKKRQSSLTIGFKYQIISVGIGGSHARTAFPDMKFSEWGCGSDADASCGGERRAGCRRVQEVGSVGAVLKFCRGEYTATVQCICGSVKVYCTRAVWIEREYLICILC